MDAFAGNSAIEHDAGRSVAEREGIFFPRWVGVASAFGGPATQGAFNFRVVVGGGVGVPETGLKRVGGMTGL